MATRSFEKSVKGATKIKDAPPKTKYIEHILVATHAGEAGVGEVFRALQPRLQDSSWTVVFKSLITIHLMMREGSSDVTLSYLAKHRNILGISVIMDGQPQGKNIRHYAAYLSERAKAFRDTKCDWVRGKESRLEKLTVGKGLLRETEVVQSQLTALLKCDVIDDAVENEITITVFRLLVLDLLALFQAVNQAMVNILGHFFEMSKPDAERALEIYRTFTKQTDYVVQYLSVARQFASHTRVEVPKLKHAPINLGPQLEEYLKDPDFEVNRRQYLAELDVKKKGGGSAATSKMFGPTGASKPSASTTAAAAANGSSQAAKPAQASKGPDPDLIDFFDSIEQHQMPMSTQPNPQMQQQQLQQQQLQQQQLQQQQMQAQLQQQQQVAQQQMPMQTGMTPWGPAQTQMNGFQPQQTGFQITNPFQQNMGAFAQQHATQQPMQQPAFTGAGFGGFSPQTGFQPGALGSIPQNSVASFQRPQTQAGLQPGQQTTNPFRQSMLMAQQTGAAVVPNNSTFSAPTSPPTGLSPQNTNPFARSSTIPVQQEQPQIQQQMPPQQLQLQFNSPTQTNPVFSPPAAVPLQPMVTGTNPFAKNYGGAAQRPATSGGILSGGAGAGAGGGLVPQPTGTTNPFRQGAFVNHQTGLGWQHGQQPIGGGLDTLETVPVFPRPASQSPWQG